MNLCIPASPETEPMVKLPLLLPQGLLGAPLPLGSKAGTAEILGYPLLLQRAGALLLLPLCQLSPMCHRMMGLELSSVSPQSLQRQPHAASLVLQAFKLPFYLNLCPEIQAEKGPFQSQFLLYGFMGIVAGSCRRCLLFPHGTGACGHMTDWFVSCPARNSCLVPQC